MQALNILEIAERGEKGKLAIIIIFLSDLKRHLETMRIHKLLEIEEAEEHQKELMKKKFEALSKYFSEEDRENISKILN